MGYLNKKKFRKFCSGNFFIFLFLVILFFSCNKGSKNQYPVELSTDLSKVTLYQGEKQDLKITIKNNTYQIIGTREGYFFSYHVYDPGGSTISYDNKRYEIPLKILPNSAGTCKIPLYFRIKKPGEYIVEFDMVKEGSFWGSTRNWQVPRIKLNLKSLFSPEFKQEYLKKKINTANVLLDKEQYLLRITLKNSEIYHEGKLFGFSAGSQYPAVWIRDTATFTSLALFYYPIKDIQRSIEHFFVFQRDSGEVMDSVNTAGITKKNTIETDQESSLIIAAYKIWKENPEWIDHKINQVTILERMEKALNWVLQNRSNLEYGLIKSGFTADWGDVGKDYADRRALQLNPDTTRVLGIYTQAKYIQAITCLIEMFKGCRNPPNNKIMYWHQIKKNIKDNTRKYLYLPEKGYFITHIVPSDPKYYPLEREILAVGGNAEAIIAGLMNKNEINAFILELDRRRKKYNLGTVGFTLIPPYPEGFFIHPLLKQPWKYQNGGEWDWIGGRLVLALILNDFVKKAEEYLLEIVSKNLKHLNINEWQDRQGRSRGANFYTGAAGVIGEAIIQGYLNQD